jgi:hypothetical protein
MFLNMPESIWKNLIAFYILVSEKVSGKALGKNSNSLSNDMLSMKFNPSFWLVATLKKYQF